jgi:hypothetical protein
VHEFYTKFNEQKGTQLVFCDIGTPKPTGFNVYSALKTKLVEEYSIPENEVVFIHDYNERTRGKLFDQVNNGTVRVLIGSTDKAGTGLNVQARMVAMHHLDIPWKPSELEQRSGRGARQGNWVAKEYNFIYAVEQSLDNYKFTLLKNKQTFISQMKTQELSVRSIDEGSFDESTGMNFAEYIAILSGDTSLLEKAKIDKKLAVLENLRTIHYRSQSANKLKLKHDEERIIDVQEVVDTLQRDTDLFMSSATFEEGGGLKNTIEIFALKEKLQKLAVDTEAEALLSEMEKQQKKLLKMLKLSPERKVVVEGEEKEKLPEPAVVIGQYLIDLFNAWNPFEGQTNEHIGTLFGFNLYIERVTNQEDSFAQKRAYTGTGNNVIFFNRLYAQNAKGGMKYMYNQGVPSRENSKLAARCFLQAISRCSKVLVTYKDELDILRRSIEGLKGIEEKPFDKEVLIQDLREESKRLEREINLKIQQGKNN